LVCAGRKTAITIKSAHAPSTNTALRSSPSRLNIHDLDAADDRRIAELANREIDPCLVLSETLAPFLVRKKIDRPIAEIEPNRGRVIRPADIAGKSAGMTGPMVLPSRLWQTAG